MIARFIAAMASLRGLIRRRRIDAEILEAPIISSARSRRTAVVAFRPKRRGGWPPRSGRAGADDRIHP